MKVKELIEKLQKLPPNASVSWSCEEGLDVSDAEPQFRLDMAESKPGEINEGGWVWILITNE